MAVSESFTCFILYNEREISKRTDYKGNYQMRKQLASPAMGVALTLLLAGVTVQVTDFFELFGHNSVIPVLIGLAIIVVGIPVVLIMYRYAKGKKGG
jgi:divalent metal cation (Fe/Co/Zn/Cd) transporter